MQVDRQFRLAVRPHHWRQHDLLHHGPDRLLRLFHPLRFPQRPDQRPDPLAVGARHRRVEPHRVRRGLRRELTLELLPPCVERVHPLLHLLDRHAGDDRIHQLGVVALHLGQLLLQPLAVRRGTRRQPVPLRGVFLAEDPHRRLVHQVMLERVQHPAFQVGLLDDGPVCADRRTLAPRRRAAEAVPPFLRDAGAAAAALHQPRKQELRPPPVPDGHLRSL
nr:hypothetical protein [Rhodobacter sp. CZR27]